MIVKDIERYNNMNKINFEYFNEEKISEIIEKSKIKIPDYNTIISFNYHENYYNFDYLGLKFIKHHNTNKLIRTLLFNEENIVNSNISINNIPIKNKDIIIISPFTKINDILSSKVNGNVHNFLKDEGIIETNSKIESTIVDQYNSFNKIFELTDLNLAKVDLINYVDIKDSFISEDNIELIFEILKNNTSKKLIILNDVDYINIKKIEKYITNFNFLYIINENDDSYKNILNYENFLILIKDNLMDDLYSKK